MEYLRSLSRVDPIPTLALDWDFLDFDCTGSGLGIVIKCFLLEVNVG